MELAVLNTQGKETGRKVVLSDAVFGVEANDHAIYLDVKQYLADQRQGTHKSKQRNEVAGSTRKLKRQKGTGGARCSIPLAAFPGRRPRVRSPAPRLQLQARQEAQATGTPQRLTSKAQAGAISVVEAISMEAPKTKSVVALRGAEGVGQEGAPRTAGIERERAVVVPQPPVREARAGSERLHLRRDERIGHRDGGGRRECFEYDVSLKTQSYNGHYY